MMKKAGLDLVQHNVPKNLNSVSIEARNREVATAPKISAADAALLEKEQRNSYMFDLLMTHNSDGEWMESSILTLNTGIFDLTLNVPVLSNPT